MPACAVWRRRERPSGDGRWQFEAATGYFRHRNGQEALVYVVRPVKGLASTKASFTHTRQLF
jgi:hypothetical protein